jgi:predicted nucleic acid-binding protein
MRVLIDTNIVVRMTTSDHPDSVFAQAAIDHFNEEGTELCIVPQILFELWAVATRPAAQNGLGFTIRRSLMTLQSVRRMCTLLPDPPELVDRWQALIVRHEAKGKSSHDARLIAAMQLHGLEHLLTFNGSDFRRYPGLTLLAPGDLRG